MIDLENLKRSPKALEIYRSKVRLEKNGKEYCGKCCFHSEKTGSLTVGLEDGKWLFNCFGCGAAGSIIDFVQKFDKVSLKEAISRIENLIKNSWNSQKEIVESTLGPAFPEENKVTYPIEQYAAYEKALAENTFVQNWIFKERGITYETIKRLRLGYRQEIKAKKPELQELLNKGWIVFPRFENNRIIGLHYRSIVRKAFARQFGMKTALFNIETIDPLETLYVVEGEFDACALEQVGFRAISIPNATSEITADMRDQIMQADTIILAGDCDNGVGRDKMRELWSQLQERTFLLEWPEKCKDANDALRKTGDDVAFRVLVDELTARAKTTPIPHIFNLAESMSSSARTNLLEHPKRLRAPWRGVDKMAVMLPGSIMSLSATNTKQGKTQFSTQWSLYAAMEYNEVVINYQAELDVDEFANIVASHLLKKSRNNLTAEDYKLAAKMMGNVKYYIGRNPTFNTVEPVLELMEGAIRRLGGTLCVIDHIHFLCRNTQNEIQTQADAMQKLKNLAVKYGCKIIVVSQPRKAQSNAKGKVLHVTDIKGSETLTSDADAIFVLHRDIIKNKDEQTMDDYSPETEIHLLGARSKGDGSTFSKLLFRGDICTFSELAYSDHNTPQTEESIF